MLPKRTLRPPIIFSSPCLISCPQLHNLPITANRTYTLSAIRKPITSVPLAPQRCTHAGPCGTRPFDRWSARQWKGEAEHPRRRAGRFIARRTGRHGLSEKSGRIEGNSPGLATRDQSGWPRRSRLGTSRHLGTRPMQQLHPGPCNLPGSCNFGDALVLCAGLTASADMVRQPGAVRRIRPVPPLLFDFIGIFPLPVKTFRSDSCSL